jgi:DNA-binding NarL/FixJ family response regulator
VIRVLVAEDHGLVRAGLEQLIENMDDVELVGSAADGAAAAALAAERRPDVVLMDL